MDELHAQLKDEDPYKQWEARFIQEDSTAPRYMRAAKWDLKDAKKRIQVGRLVYPLFPASSRARRRGCGRYRASWRMKWAVGGSGDIVDGSSRRRRAR